MAEDRSWMYNRIEKGLVRSEFRDGVLRFVDFALHQPGCTDGAKIKCPCILPKCRNKRYLEVDEVMIHLCRKGFIPHYEVWSSHGERFVHKDTHVGESSNRVDYRGDYIQMVMDAAGPEMFDVEMDEEPNPDAKKFYELLDAASKPLYPGSEKHTQLSFISRILNVKCESKMSNSAFSDVLQLIKEVIPEPNPGVPGNYYQAKKEETDAFTLPKSRKQSWFDNHRKFLPPNHPFRRNRNDFRKNVTVLQRSAPVHRSGEQIKIVLDHLGLKKVTELGHVETNKRVCDNCGWKRRSIFWDLPYWSSLLIRHNLDFMHIEKNCFEQIFNTVCHIKDKTKDTISSREELNDICRRPTLMKDNTTGQYPKASYVLDPQSRRKMFDWLEGLRFPDGWMYPFERYLRNLKSNVKNKNKVEGSIANAFLMEELCYFTTFYFEDQVQTKLRIVARNADEFVSDDDDKDAIFVYYCFHFCFQRYFAWDEADDAAYYTAWKQHAARMYAVLMNRFHDTYKKKAMKHPALSDAQYQQWCVHWSDPDFQKISSIKRDNRHSEVCGQGTGMSRHLGGSIPVLKHMDNMRKKASGESPNAWEVFQKIKCRNGVPVDEQSKQIKDRMDARIKQLTDEGVAYDINEVFGEVNAKTKKQRVVGLGSATSSFCIAPSGPSGESSGQSTRQVTEEIQQLKENLNIKDEEIRRLKEEQESMKEQFNEKLAEVFRRLDGTNEC
ncbi:hypothetical protein POM88_031013 [Heracleum sosnowskyi]|uniref:Transposase-associated domain-containing protein n=1 Tax=Heracleum sosnowskyi TaxID=360622 RepID=A0AAD8MG90_9APIA|nr:hypothetical protein POM88_031013 [Heracleum sosnowskyi]